jgi:hypothetical protein
MREVVDDVFVEEDWVDEYEPVKNKKSKRV